MHTLAGGEWALAHRTPILGWTAYGGASVFVVWLLTALHHEHQAFAEREEERQRREARDARPHQQEERPPSHDGPVLV